MSLESERAKVSRAAPAGPTADEVTNALREGVRLFNHGAFFETHEVLEEVWRPAGGEMKRFLKGLIHAAIALYQYGRQNGVGARSKYESTLYYLAPFQPEFAGVDVAALLRDLQQYFEPFLICGDDGKAPVWRGADEARPRIRFTSFERGARST